MDTRKILMAVAAVVAIAGTACGSNAKADTSSSQSQTVRVTEGDMFLRTSGTAFSAGKITFVVTNQGSIHHEFVIVTGDPTGTKGDEAGRVSEADHIGGDAGPEIGDVAPGQTKRLTVDLTAGSYTAMCNLPGHYMAGMHFGFTVV